MARIFDASKARILAQRVMFDLRERLAAGDISPDAATAKCEERIVEELNPSPLAKFAIQDILLPLAHAVATHHADPQANPRHSRLAENWTRSAQRALLEA